MPRFLLGLGHGGANALTGMAGIAVSPLPYLWTFHLRHSILPAFGALPTALAVVALQQGFALFPRDPRSASLRARGGVRIAVAGLLMLSVVLSLTDGVRITATMHS